MELRHLRYFIAVAEELNFRKAAERLHIEQPPLSRQIRQLEDELSTPLFLRSRREVSLTEAGKAFLGEARLTMSQAERAMNSVQKFNNDLPKKLTIGYLICAFDQLLADAMQSFRDNNSEVEIVLKGMNSTPQVEAILSGEIDVGFIYLPVHHPEVLTRLVLRKSLVVALPTHHPLASSPTISLDSLADQPMIIYPRFVKPDFYDLIITLCQQAGFQPKIVQEATPPELVLSLVAAGVGISLVGSSVKTRHDIGVVYRPIKDFETYLDIGIAWHRGRSVALVSNFLDVVKRITPLSIVKPE